VTGVEAFDLLVVGGGMAGMAAAAQAAELGARVAVCEVADQLGGTALLSTGNVWTVDTAEAFRTADPDGDPSLWRAVRAGLFDSLEWVASLG
jgi:succinate dehydrogenase/fumarate reductase flavoprotein subunit